MEVLVPVLTAFVTFVLTAVGTYLTTRRNLQLQYDADLRKLRIDVYLDLWSRLEVLSKYARPDLLARSDVQGLALSLKEWYFTKGGLYLSGDTRADYFALQDALSVLSSGPATLDEASDEFVRVLGSRLRTGMTRDVGTRKTFIFRRDTPGSRASATARTYTDERGGRKLRISVARPRRRTAKVEIANDANPSERVAKKARWDPARASFALTVSEDERLFLAEAGHVVEGPKGWNRDDERDRAEPVLWHRAREKG